MRSRRIQLCGKIGHLNWNQTRPRSSVGTAQIRSWLRRRQKWRFLEVSATVCSFKFQNFRRLEISWCDLWKWKILCWNSKNHLIKTHNSQIIPTYFAQSRSSSSSTNSLRQIWPCHENSAARTDQTGLALYVPFQRNCLYHACRKWRTVSSELAEYAKCFIVIKNQLSKLCVTCHACHACLACIA
jgi:hypothetical protein